MVVARGMHKESTTIASSVLTSAWVSHGRAHCAAVNGNNHGVEPSSTLSAVVETHQSKGMTPASDYHNVTSLRHFCCIAIISAAIRPIKITRRLLETFASGFRRHQSRHHFVLNHRTFYCLRSFVTRPSIIIRSGMRKRMVKMWVLWSKYMNLLQINI